MNTSSESVIASTKCWLENIVIGLNLCPFAKAIHVQNQIRYRVSTARCNQELMDDLQFELTLMLDTAPEDIESTLLIHPEVLNDFSAYNLFLADCDQAILDSELEGIIQIASFHPQYQFAGTKSDDVTNYTNRSPFPILHLLREASVTQAVESYPNVDGIYQKNMATLKKLGIAKMVAMLKSQSRTELDDSTA